MSAHLCSNADFDYLVSAASIWRMNVRLTGRGLFDNDPNVTDAERSEVLHSAGAVWRNEQFWWTVLKRENIRSLQYRYPVGLDEEEQDWGGTFRRTLDIKVPVLAKAIKHYMYQACEHPGWDDSAARAFCAELEQEALRRIDGFDQAPWGLSESDVHGDSGPITSLFAPRGS